MSTDLRMNIDLESEKKAARSSRLKVKILQFNKWTVSWWLICQLGYRFKVSFTLTVEETVSWRNCSCLSNRVYLGKCLSLSYISRGCSWSIMASVTAIRYNCWDDVLDVWAEVFPDVSRKWAFHQQHIMLLDWLMVVLNWWVTCHLKLSS